MGLGGAQFILVAFPDLCGSLREFGFETRPYALLVVVVLLLKQAEGLFSTELRYTGKVTDAKSVKNLGALQFPRTTTQWALDGVVHFAVLPHVYVYGRCGAFVWFCGKSSVTRTLGRTIGKSHIDGDG